MHVNAIPIQFRPQFPLTHMPFQMPQNQHQATQQQPQEEQVHHAMPQFRFGSPPMAQQQQQQQFSSFRQIPLPLQPLIRQIQQSHEVSPEIVPQIIPSH